MILIFSNLGVKEFRGRGKWRGMVRDKRRWRLLGRMMPELTSLRSD
jgi:hypothetical protein